MEICDPQDFLDEIHSARKNRHITASFLQKKIVKSRCRRAKKKSSNQGVFFGKKPRQIKCDWSVINIAFLKEFEEDFLNLKMIKINVNFLPVDILYELMGRWYKLIRSLAAERTYFGKPKVICNYKLQSSSLLWKCKKYSSHKFWEGKKFEKKIFQLTWLSNVKTLCTCKMSLNFCSLFTI